MRVLIIDDEPDDREMFAAAILDADRKARIVSLAEPPESYKEFIGYDLAVIDYNLGAGRVGTDVIAALRREGYIGKTVLVTGMTFDPAAHDYYCSKAHYAYFQQLCHFVAMVVS